MSEKPTAKLNNWSIAMSSGDMDPLYCPPECWYTVFQGNVTESTKFSDNDIIHTSNLVGWNRETRTIETRNTLYQLLDIDPKYADKYDKEITAEEQLFNKLDEVFAQN